MRHARAEDGFTLVEMLVAIALLALIVSGIAGGLQLGRVVSERDGDLERRGEAEAASRGIAALVAAAYPAGAVLEGGRPTLIFQGTSGALRFVSLSEGRAQVGGLIETEIGLEGGPGAQRLMVWTGVYRAETAARLSHADMHATEHAHGVRVLAFSYFGAIGEGAAQAPPGWRSDWAGRQRLPALVSIRLVMDVRGGAIEVPVTVEVVQR